ncbi:MAG: hypothetical protein I8H77_13585 [Comamonadaceae bacterium]|nr:hypothetical protein [Comamonadaceae bacterium]
MPIHANPSRDAAAYIEGEKHAELSRPEGGAVTQIVSYNDHDYSIGNGDRSQQLLGDAKENKQLMGWSDEKIAQMQDRVTQRLSDSPGAGAIAAAKGTNYGELTAATRNKLEKMLRSADSAPEEQSAPETEVTLQGFIRSSDLASVKSSVGRGADRDSIGGFFERIVLRFLDMCGGTNRTELRKLAFDLYSPETSARLKFQSFERLKSLVGDDYKSNFTQQEVSGGDAGRIAFAIDLGDGENFRFETTKRELFFDQHDVQFEQHAIKDQLQAVIGQAIDSEQLTQWEKDLPRTGVFLGGVFCSNEEQFVAASEALGCSKNEVEFIKKTCVQTTNGIIWNRAVKGVQLNSAVIQEELRAKYEVSRGVDGNLKLDVLVEFDKSENMPFHAMAEYMEIAVESEQGLLSASGKPILQIREGDLKLSIEYSAGNPQVDPQMRPQGEITYSHLSGHIGKYVDPFLAQ